MNQEENNFNNQGNNGLSNNQSLNTNQNNSQIDANIYQKEHNIQNNVLTKKKKLKWWIPLLFFIGGFLMLLCNSTVGTIIRSQGEFILEYEITNYPIIIIFRWLAVICWFMVIPSLIFVVVKYNKKN